MPGILCEHCTGLCCRYISLPVDTPTTKRDFDDIRWFMLHEGVTAYIEDGDWYVNIQTPCRHLLPDHRCGIYETRPAVCRAYTTENCEYHAGDYDFEHHFASPADVEAYAREYFRQLRLADGTAGGRTGKNGRRRATAAGRKRAKRRAGVRARLARRRIRLLEPLISSANDGRGVALPILALSAAGEAAGAVMSNAERARGNGNGRIVAARGEEAVRGSEQIGVETRPREIGEQGNAGAMSMTTGGLRSQEAKRVGKPVSRGGLETRPTNGDSGGARRKSRRTEVQVGRTEVQIRRADVQRRRTMNAAGGRA